ncbi:MAG: hypothetical protein ACQUYJ_17225, partial [Ferruginibacter sp.]
MRNAEIYFFTVVVFFFSHSAISLNFTSPVDILMINPYKSFPTAESSRLFSESKAIIASKPALKGAPFFVQFLIGAAIGDHLCVSEA